MQALSIAWDARAQAEGGERWFHLYPNERINHRDPLHWTRLNQNWNTMCAECHMPTSTYMVVDPRHDHSLRVPRPDLTLKVGVPNACHRDKDPSWAVAAIEKSHGPGRKGFQTFAEALRVGRSGARGAQGMLIALAGDATAPAIARATAVAELRRFPGRAALPANEQALLHFDPLLRELNGK